LPLLRVLQAREHGDGVVATAQELPDRNAAEAMQGARIFISRASFPTPDDGEFYWVDLIGLAVSNREGVLLGRWWACSKPARTACCVSSQPMPRPTRC
jgi:16S rRNA processing protein RimM